ncbi:radical SAM protein [Geminocystis sp. GBBB08]|uniref:radical SAM protein n=1 Tax=Geminocystis sp. GBBB08 TaxID=2604140 RepID=UPI0027E2A696|nr:radical SAM protein [Geminocystis sp. GBBB08]
MKHFFFNIDTLGLGQCNLRCPSCPIGNSDVKNPTGLMSPELLEKILIKAKQECYVSGVGLFSWTEPLLHPQISDLIKIIENLELKSFISSNLNIKKDFFKILEANPTTFRVSLSGFNQSIYSQFHKGGDIELVKENMKKLSDAKKQTGAKTNIHVLYHRYLGNLDDEILMRDYANSLGFDFQPVWAYFMNLDKQIAYLEGDKSALTTQDLDIINKMVIPYWETTKMLQKYKHSPCTLREDQMTLDKDGNVQLCCGAYDANKYTITNFLSSSIDEIQNMKSQHPTCNQCMDQAIHVYGIYGTIGSSEIDEYALNNITQYYLEKLGIFIGM